MKQFRYVRGKKLSSVGPSRDSFYVAKNESLGLKTGM